MDVDGFAPVLTLQERSVQGHVFLSGLMRRFEKRALQLTLTTPIHSTQELTKSMAWSIARIPKILVSLKAEMWSHHTAFMSFYLQIFAHESLEPPFLGSCVSYLASIRGQIAPHPRCMVLEVKGITRVNGLFSSSSSFIPLLLFLQAENGTRINICWNWCLMR